MSSPRISESLNKFFSVSNSKFDADDVINMKEGGAQKAGTFRQWNVFRLVGRSKAEVRANNETRQQFLDSLKESFGLTETGQELVDRLGSILGKGVFKPEDYTFKDGRLDCGKPLTARRITDVSKVVAQKAKEAKLRKLFDGMEKVSTAAHDLRYFINSNSSELGSALGASLANADPKMDSRMIENIMSNVYILNDNAVSADLIGLSTALRISIEKAKIFPDNPPKEVEPKDWDKAREAKRDKLADDILNVLKGNGQFAKVYGQHEKLLDEYYQDSEKDRKQTEDRALSINAALAGLVQHREVEGLKS